MKLNKHVIKIYGNYYAFDAQFDTCSNGGPHVEPLDWLALVWEGISFVKESLGSGSPSFRVLPQCRRPVHLSVLY